jgi:hypothetical protein
MDLFNVVKTKSYFLSVTKILFVMPNKIDCRINWYQEEEKLKTII